MSGPARASTDTNSMADMIFMATLQRLSFFPKGTMSEKAEAPEMGSAPQCRERVDIDLEGTAQRAAPSGLRELVTQAVWNDTAIISKLLHHGLVKGHVLLSRAVGCSVDVQFARELLACRQAGIQVQQLQKIDNRALVVAAAISERTAPTSTDC